MTDSFSEVRAVQIDSMGAESGAESGDLSPTRVWRTSPLVRRKSFRRQKQKAAYSALAGGSAASDMLFYPRSLDCIKKDCHRLLSPEEARWGTNLCNMCWDTSSKLCNMCTQTLPLKQLQWGTELCKTCFNACDKECQICKLSLAVGQLHWGTGLCDACYNESERVCRLCQVTLQAGQLRWGSGLCDPCYNSCQKTCKICNVKIKVRQVRWNTGICNDCYDDCQKTCSDCKSDIPLGSMHYRTGLCDACYDSRRKHCTTCGSRLTLQHAQHNHGLCDDCYMPSKVTCKMCRSSLEDQQQHWGTGLCDLCYDECQKDCKLCQVRIPFGQLHWASGLCDKCYSSCEKKCRKCGVQLPLGQLRWGTGLCDGCFDGCEKTCRGCKCRIDVGQVSWGTGLCNTCYDNTRAQDGPRRGITFGVWAIIGAQFAFYLAPSLLQPSLFLQIRDKGYLPNPPTVYAAVLTTASIVAMLLPAPLGLWAEYLGERQVYVGVSLGACLSSALLMTSPPASVLAIAWAILNGPPSVRGIHAAYFAKHVAPEDLSWAGQMASSAGLIGGFLGPFVCMLAEGMLGDGSDGAWWDGLTGSALFAAAISMVCAFVLAACLPGKTGRGLSHTSRDSVSLEQCERCSQELDEKERGYATALCDKCWDNYAGVEYSFKRFQLHLLVKWCIIAGLLEFSLNAGIVATFQPVVVTHFNWGSFAIASVTAMGTGLGVVISLAMTCLRLRPKWQTLAASLLYLLGLSIFTAQPLQPWRVILGYLLGIKAQVLFMSPFIAIFSSLIGPVRVTNALTTVLCLAPLVGAALGTSAAPAFMAVSNSPLFILVSLPAFVAVVVIGLEWDLMEGDIEKLRRVARHS